MSQATDLETLFARAARLAADHRATLPARRVAAEMSRDVLLERVARPLQDGPTPAATVLEELVADFDPGVVATPGPRFFGFVIGGALPAASAADMVATGWDQCGFNAALSPAASVAETVAGDWVKDLLSLPPDASVGFVTGAQGANTVGLAATAGP